MKRTIVFALALLAATICGCKCDKYENVNGNDVKVMNQGFNDTRYFWEDLFFPTNRTTGR